MDTRCAKYFLLAVFLVCLCKGDLFYRTQTLDPGPFGMVVSDFAVLSMQITWAGNNDVGSCLPTYHVRESTDSLFSDTPISPPLSMTPSANDNCGQFGWQGSMAMSVDGLTTVIGGSKTSTLYVYSLSDTSINATFSVQQITCDDCPLLGEYLAMSGDGSIIFAVDSVSPPGLYLFEHNQLAFRASAADSQVDSVKAVAISYDGSSGALGYYSSEGHTVINCFNFTDSQIISTQNFTFKTAVTPGLGSGNVLLIGDPGHLDYGGRVLVFTRGKDGLFSYQFQVPCPTKYPGMCGEAVSLSPDDTRWTITGYNGCYIYEYNPETMVVTLVQSFLQYYVPLIAVSWDATVLGVGEISYGSYIDIWEAPPIKNHQPVM